MPRVIGGECYAARSSASARPAFAEEVLHRAADFGLPAEAPTRWQLQCQGDVRHLHLFLAARFIERVPWPDAYPGRALRNRFAECWHRRGAALAADAEGQAEYARARAAGDYGWAVIYARQAVGQLHRERPVAEAVRELGVVAEQLLRARCSALL